MRLEELVAAVEGEILVRGNHPDVRIQSAFAADLLSDVLSLSQAGTSTTLITGMVNPQVMRVAEILGIAIVIVVRGKVPPPSMVDYAEELGIPLVASPKGMFETCGLMYQHGVAPGEIHPVHDTRERP